KVPEGATVLVAGGGGIGISIMQGARIGGATRIILSDPVESRREAAAKFGATDVIDPSKEDVVARVLQITNGIGVDNSFDAVGATAAIGACIGATRTGGTTTLVGAGALDQTIPMPPPVMWTLGERKLIGSTLGRCYGRPGHPGFVHLWATGR